MENKLRRVCIAGTGAFLPENVVTNAMIEARGVDTSHEWIVERTGIHERRMVTPGTGVSDLGAPASRQALEAAGIRADQLDAIVFATTTPDHVTPPASSMLQREIGAEKAAAFDVSAGCSGFVVGFDVGRAMVASGPFENVLVVGGDVMSAIIDPLQRDTCIIFGDGAGAVLLRPSAEGDGEVLRTTLGGQGEYDVMHMKAGGSKYPATAKTVAAREHFFHMEGRKVYKFAVNKIVELVREVLDETGYDLADVACFVPHQMNQLILESAFVRNLGVPWEKVVVNLNRYGNTTAGTVPIALDEAVRDGRIKRGDLVVMLAVGAGLSWGAALVRY